MGWLEDLAGVGRLRWGHDQAAAAEAAARANILANAELDRRRAERRDGAGETVVRWKRQGGVWQRWSELDAGFVAAPAPESLLLHARSAEVADDQELHLVEGAWVPWRGEPAEPAVPLRDDASELGAEVAPPPTSVPPAPPPAPPTGTAPAPEAEAADFEAQLAAWRRRRA